jgi:Protein of unknown function (DUF3396)
LAWFDDAVFSSVLDGGTDADAVSSFAAPAFRLAVLSPLEQAHPFQFHDAYCALFDSFRPILEQFSDRLNMIERPGAEPRRRKSIKPDDWRPFEHMRSVIPPDDGHFIGFAFLSGAQNKGPASFRFSVTGCVQLDVTIPVSAWLNGALDLERVKSALAQLPFGTGLCGYGLSLSEDAGKHSQANENLVKAAVRYPALDVARNYLRSWNGSIEYDQRAYWLAGINWLTFVGQPFLSALGGVEEISRGLPSQIAVAKTASGVMFQLGDRPVTGEKNVDDDLLPLYHALGRKLQPPGNGHPSEQNRRRSVFGDKLDVSLKWERRFYDGKWFAENAQ